MIRGWLLALERDDYVGAADYFAVGAIIDQGDPFRLPSLVGREDLQRVAAMPRRPGWA